MQVVVRAVIDAVDTVVPLRSSEIERLAVTQELGAHTRCSLTFGRDHDTDLNLDMMLGAGLTVSLEDDIGNVEIFVGTVTSGKQEHQVNHGSIFHLEGLSKSWKYERRQTAYFPQSTFADVANKLGVDLVMVPSTDQLEFVQYGETDFAFLLRLADEFGAFVRPVGRELQIRTDFEDIGPTLVWGNDLLAVSAQVHSAPNMIAGAAHYFQEKRDHRFRGLTKEPEWSGGASRLTSAATRMAGLLSTAAGEFLIEELPYRSRTLDAGRAYLEQQSARRLGTAVMVDCSGNNIRVRAGDTITLEESEAFALPTRGKLGVVRVTHAFDGHLYSNTFTASPWKKWTNLKRPERAHIGGPTTGTVVDNVDPEQMGRIKIRMRWLDDGESTRWVRMMMPYTGNDRGVMFLPEIDDEVVVAFELGDPERPIALGSLWNGRDKAPSMDNNEVKRIVTRSGNTIQFFDTPGNEERIEIFSATGQCWIQLANNGGQPLLTIHSEGDISIEAENEIRLKCNTLVERVGSNAYRKTGGNNVADVGGNHTEKVSGKIAMDAASVLTKAGGPIDAVAGALHSIVGSLVHIQPPVHVALPVIVTEPPQPASPWDETDVPNLAEESTSADAKSR